MTETIYIVSTSICYDIDGEYEIIKAFRTEKDAEKFIDEIEDDQDLKDKYYIRSEFDNFRYDVVELE